MPIAKSTPLVESHNTDLHGNLSAVSHVYFTLDLGKEKDSHEKKRILSNLWKL